MSIYISTKWYTSTVYSFCTNQHITAKHAYHEFRRPSFLFVVRRSLRFITINKVPRVKREDNFVKHRSCIVDHANSSFPTNNSEPHCAISRRDSFQNRRTTSFQATHRCAIGLLSPVGSGTSSTASHSNQFSPESWRVGLLQKRRSKTQGNEPTGASSLIEPRIHGERISGTRWSPECLSNRDENESGISRQTIIGLGGHTCCSNDNARWHDLSDCSRCFSFSHSPR